MNTVVKIQSRDVGSIPYQEASIDIWDKKYRLTAKDGTPIDKSMDDTYKRVARALADVESDENREQWYESFLWALRHGAIPAGRVTSNAGALQHKPATSTINCTVSGTIRDSMDDILKKVHEAGLTLKAGCVAPGTLVRTEFGLVTADRAVAEKHREILCYDREEHRFEMRPITRHLTTHVPQAENIRITSNGATLTTSVKHPVLVQRDGKFTYVRADEVLLSDSLVHHCFPWSAESTRWRDAWFAGAHLGDGSAYPKKFSYTPSRSQWARRASALGQRLILKIRAAEREVVGRYADFFASFSATRSAVAATLTKRGAPVWDFTVASCSASRAVDLIDGRSGVKSATLRIPGWIAAKPELHFLPFLAGLIDTDGTVDQRGNAVIGTQSREFARELQSVIALFGVHASITSIAPREHEFDGVTIRGSGGAVVKICDSGFLAAVAEYMADSGKRRRIAEFATTSGQYDVFHMHPALRKALEFAGEKLTHRERQRLGYYHGYTQRDRISRVWLDRWSERFHFLAPLIALTKRLRPVDAIERGLPLPTTFFDFTVEKHNNYLAGNCGLMVIHNCGIGYEFSTLRPRGAYVSGAGAYTSGPLSFMDIYDKMCFTVSSAGGRRGAQMGTFEIGHPDALEFIRAKRENGRLRQFNLSLLVTDEFMHAVKNDGEWQLAFPISGHEYESEKPDLNDAAKFVWREWPYTEGYVANQEGLVACKIYKTLPARRVWDLIMTSTYDFAEPGFILIDKVNEMNNNWWTENIRATNPCVTADTRLATQFGMVRIGDLYEARVDIQATVDNRALGGGLGVDVREAVPAFMTSQSADVYRVVTEDGYEIKATEWHDFYTTRGKIKLKDLQPGDELLIQSGKGQFGGCGSAELGQLLGLLTGDGHFTNCGRNNQAAVVNLWGADRALAESVVTTVNGLIAGYAARSRDYRVSSVAVPERNLVMIRSVILARVLAEVCGFTAECKRSVPEIVWRGSEECVKGYLRGLFQSDGTVNTSGHEQTSCSVRLASSVPNLLKGIQMLLANFGIKSRVVKRRDAGLRTLPDGKGGHKEHACRADHELIIDGESRDLFMAEIGFLSEAKNSKYERGAEDKAPRKRERYTSKIFEITHVGREAVFDTTQADNNTVIFNGLVTGQCGEQPLPPYGSCLLGSVNLTKFIREPFTETAHFDWDEYRKVVKIFTRMLDNVVEVNGLPLPQQRDEILRKRRHGMGFLGLGSSITMLGMKYGSKKSVAFTQNVSREMALAGWEAALELAREKGPAPIMNEEFIVTREMLRKRPEMVQDGWRVGAKVPGRVLHARYSRYMQRIAEAAPELVDELAEVGARFTHHTSIAPTGTISLSLANNASNGIEPSFAHHYFRNVIREGKKSKEKIDVFSFELLAYRELINSRAMPNSQNPGEKLPDYFISADDIGPKEHVDIQAAAQLWIDSSISKTANVPTDYKYEDFKDIYMYAYDQGLKGCTTFRFNPEAFQGVLVKEDDLKNTIYVFTLEDGTEVEARGDEQIEYDGEMHTAANLFDALKEGYYGKF
jgi:ribonucleoside-diphosphate reductase alpha chain